MADRDSHGDYGASRPSTSWTVVNAARVEEMILENRLPTFRDLSATFQNNAGVEIDICEWLQMEGLGFYKFVSKRYRYVNVLGEFLTYCLII